MKHLKPMRYLKGLCLLVLSIFSQLTHAIDAAEEYEIKAVYFYNLGSFATWPESAFVDNTQVNLCILGEDPFGETLDFIVQKNKTIKERPVMVKRLSKIEQAKGCHLLFIDDSMKPKLDSIFSWLKSQPVLSVSDIKNFVVKGGMIEFYRRDNKVRLQLDPVTLDEAGLKVSAQLMKIAKIVKHQGGGQ